MTFYELLIPQITILLGIFIIVGLEIWGEERELSFQWVVQIFALVLATIQQILLYRVPSTLFVRGGMVLDGISQILSVSILVLSIMVQVWRRRENNNLSAQANLLALGATLFALFSVQSNRILFGFISLVGLLWTTQASLGAENSNRKQAAIIHSALVRSICLIVGGIVLCLLCFSTFGETQLDEMQRILARPQTNLAPLIGIELFILFIASVVMGLPPVQGLLGFSRRHTSWPLAVGATSTFAVVGLGIFLRWGIFVFSRPNIGALELEPLGAINIFLDVRMIAALGLICVPLLALFNKDLRGGFLVFTLNPFVQALFAFSFGRRETFGVAASHILVSVLASGLLISSVETMGLPEKFSWGEWVGIGRKELINAVLLIMSMVAAAGLAPFYGSLLLDKTLCINSFYGLFLLINIGLGGYYVTRLTTLAFQREVGETRGLRNLSKAQRFWGLSQLVILIFMGIFWESLYKYGAFSIRNFFGDI